MSRIGRWLSVSVLALLPFAGCLESARVDELSCSKDKFCPDGYVCVITQTGVPGKCQKPTDAGRSDAIGVTADSMNASDGRAITDAGTDGPAPLNDGPVTSPDTLAANDEAPSPDISDEPDTVSDLLVAADLGRDVPSDIPISPPDASADNKVPTPDLAPNVTPDLPYGPEAGPDLPPASCVITGTSYANGAANPANSCQLCKLATSASSWSDADEGTACDSGKYCNGGSCKAGCFISGTYYANGAANPANACQTCQTAYALTSWTSSANGSGCGTGQVCNGATCQSGCWIGGALVGSGATNPANTCQFCKPATTTSTWSTNPDTTSCGTGKACSAGICQCTTGTDCGAGVCINVNGSDSNHCGSCTKACVAGQTCNSGTCACTKGAPACGGCLAWDFEWGSNPSPWSLELSVGATSPNGATNIGITQSKYNSGASSLIAPILIDAVNTHVAEVTVSLPCKTNLSGYSGSAYVYFAGDYPLTDFANQLIVDTWSSSGTAGDHVVPYFGNIPTNGWFKLDLGFTSSVQVDRIGITLSPASNWTGTMYVDDVVINGL